MFVVKIVNLSSEFRRNDISSAVPTELCGIFYQLATNISLRWSLET